MAEFSTGGIVYPPDSVGATDRIPVLGFGCDYVVPADVGHRARGQQLLHRLNESSDTGEDGSR